MHELSLFHPPGNGYIDTPTVRSAKSMARWRHGDKATWRQLPRVAVGSEIQGVAVGSGIQGVARHAGHPVHGDNLLFAGTPKKIASIKVTNKIG